MLVGRRREIGQLAGLIAAGRPVAVLGEAGVGKTTMIRAGLEGRPFVEAGALATLSWRPYLPLWRAFGVEFEGDTEAVADAVATRLEDKTLFLDDLQWADGHTTSLLPLLAGEVPLVLAIRRGDAGTAAALETAVAVGAELLPLGPLDGDDALRLASTLHPELSAAAARHLVERSGGNPFLLEQLAPTGAASGSLKLAVAARLRALSPDGRAALGDLALLGRPAHVRLLGAGAAEIVAAGLATSGREIAIRHALLAETTVEMLPEDERTEAHARLAARLENDGEAARHHAAAGEHAAAYEKALRAAARAVTPGERAAHLALASSCAPLPEAAALRIQAAQALLDAGEARSALAVLDAFDSDDESLRAGAALVECAAATAAGEGDRGRAAWGRAAAVEQPDADLRLRLSLVEADAARHLFDDMPRARAAAEEAYELARELGRHEQQALCLRGRARLATGASGWQEDLEGAIRGAFTADEPAIAFAAGSTLVFGLMIDGQPRAGVQIASHLADRARELRMTGWERDFRAALAGFHWHKGEPELTIEITAELAEKSGTRGRTDGWFYRSQALVDVGRFEEARALLEVVRGRAGTASTIRLFLWAASDAALWGGRPRDAVLLADECLAMPGLASEGPPLFTRLTKCWAALELGIDPGPATLAGRDLYRMGPAMPIEEQALLALAGAEHLDAARLFEESAGLWRGSHARGEVRCRWGRGEALRRAGEPAAGPALEEAEALALELGNRAVLPRIHRSLRLAGVRRSSARTVTEANLTGREREILKLVAQGLSNDVIARRLGIGQPTVVRLIRSAQRKLGAQSRTQAAALALGR